MLKYKHEIALLMASPSSCHGGGKGEWPQHGRMSMSKNSDREFVSASGTANEVVQKLAQAVYARGGRDNDLRRIISDEGLRDKLADLIVSAKSARSLAKMIAECRFRYVSSDITEERFPLTGEVADVSAMLTVTQEDMGGSNMTDAEFEAACDRQGCRQATIAEQLAYAKAKWNGRDTVAALGSSWVGPDGGRLVPCLCEHGGERRLILYWVSPGGRWGVLVLFLVVRK